MIPMMNIVAWGKTVPWVELRQVEQDLVICRALVEIFKDQFLREQLRFRGGTALNKLHFPTSQRYSEDIDLTRTTEGPVGKVLDRLREVLRLWMGQAHYDLGLIGPRLTFTMQAEDPNATAPIRVKVEIATRERTAYDGPKVIPFSVKNAWFTGNADIPTFSKEEILATKLRALLQRDKGRDVFDLAYAVVLFEDLDVPRVVTCFGKYLEAAGQAISRARPSSACLKNSKTQRSWPMCGRCSRQIKLRSSTTSWRAWRSKPCLRSSSNAFQATRGRTPPRPPSD
jgi:predicted nucleotidyltransferase component of viral defense system